MLRQTWTRGGEDLTGRLLLSNAVHAKIAKGGRKERKEFFNQYNGRS